MHSMTSTRPYLIRAMYDWILDNHCTPYIVVNVAYEGVSVPEGYIENGKIILNISQVAVKNLRLDNHMIQFNARFSGVPHQIEVPTMSVIAIYAKENGQGMVFNEDEDAPPPDDTDASGSGKKSDKASKRSHLTVVK